jgi:preprotein translocase subunit YajC
MWFISDALAQTAPAATPGAESAWGSILFMVLIFAVFYFLLIRPQVKRQKEHKTMVDGLNKGDEVITAGGLIGKITKLTDQYITLQVAQIDGKPVELSLQRGSVQTLLPKDTLKSI